MTATAHFTLPTETEEQIPASRIMQERDKARAEIERLLDERAAIADRHSRSLAQWALQLSRTRNELRETQGDLAMMTRERDHYRDVAKGHRERAERDVADRIATLERAVKSLSAESADRRTIIEELLANDAVGETCPSCGGWDEMRDEPTDCSDCFGGRVAK